MTARAASRSRRGLRAGSRLAALAVSIVLLPLTTVFASVIFAGTMSLRYRRRSRSGRGMHESQELETAIDVLVGELRVGAHPASAFAVAAEETDGPVAGACRAVAARARLGADVTAGLRGVARPRRCRRSGTGSRCAGSWPPITDWRCPPLCVRHNAISLSDNDSQGRCGPAWRALVRRRPSSRAFRCCRC